MCRLDDARMPLLEVPVHVLGFRVSDMRCISRHTLSTPMARHACRLDDAINLLLEVIRLAPNAPDPYHTLGNIFQIKGDPRKALDFFMIAAHLPPKVRPSRSPLGLTSHDVSACFTLKPFI